MIVSRYPDPAAPDDRSKDLIVYFPETEGDAAELNRMEAEGTLVPSMRIADGRTKPGVGVKPTPPDEGL